MKRLMMVLSLTLVPALAQADGFLDQVKTLAAKPEVQDAAKKAANKAVDAGKGLANKKGGGTAGKPLMGQLENEINNRLLAEARKNQCSFKSNSDQLEAGCDQKAKNLAAAILDAKKKLTTAGISGFKFEVSGHTDTRGTAAHNKELSAKRAAVMVKQLIAQGIPSAEIISVGMGSEQPLVTPDRTPEQQAANRRYELRVRL
jgi:OOP family OmpA-OmpF porin